MKIINWNDTFKYLKGARVPNIAILCDQVSNDVKKDLYFKCVAKDFAQRSANVLLLKVDDMQTLPDVGFFYHDYQA